MIHRCLLATAAALLVAAPAARADIFWTDPYDTARTQADWGSNAPGGSALGQLEGITGQTVDRSVPGSSLPSRPASVPSSRPSSAKARSDAAAMDAMAAGLLVFSVLQAMDAQADAKARAAAEAEHQRQLEAERQRQLRLQSAARQRAAWEAQEAQDSADLGSIFSGGGGTVFFGSGNRIDPASLAGMNKGQPPTEMMAAFVPPPPTPFQAQLAERGQGFVRDSAITLLKKAVTESAPPQVRNSKNALEYADRANDFVGDLFKALSPEALVKALADSDPESSQHLLSRLDRVSARASRLAFNQDSINNGEIEATAKLLSGAALTREEMEAIAEERLRASLVDRLWDRFTGSGD